MTHVATSGTFSCATIAIAGFKGTNKDLNDAYLKDPNSFKEKDGITVGRFYQDILVPVSQPLGKSQEYPFEKLMQLIDQNGMKNKYTTAVLNKDQYLGNDQYWPTQLKKWGFKLVDKTKNDLGMVCYVYVRNNGRVSIEKEEA